VTTILLVSGHYERETLESDTTRHQPVNVSCLQYK